MPVLMACPYHPDMGEINHGYTDSGPYLLHVYHALPDGGNCARYTANGFNTPYRTKLEAFEAEIAPRNSYDRLWVSAMRARYQGREKVAQRLFDKWHKKQGTYIAPLPPIEMPSWEEWQEAVHLGLAAYLIEIDELVDQWRLRDWYECEVSTADAISDILYDLGITPVAEEAHVHAILSAA